MFYVHYIFSYYNRPAPSNSTKWAEPKKIRHVFPTITVTERRLPHDGAVFEPTAPLLSPRYS